jgi:single-stranded-DNA-specific exonuclease
MSIWNIKKVNLEKVYELAENAEISLPSAKIAVSRDILTHDQLREYATHSTKKFHSPMLLPDIQPVLKRLNKAIDNQEKIFIWGDYDVDGITSTAIVVTALRFMGANLEYKVPHRMEDGYDIKLHSVDEALKRDAKLLFSVDCGIVAFETADYAKQCGLDLIITDHHHPSDDGRLPECIGVVNPNRDDPAYPGDKFASHIKPGFERYPFDALAGCGIAFKVMVALCFQRKMSVKMLTQAVLDYVALGTVADVAPMIDENRALVALGCDILSSTDKSGLKELLRVAGVKEVSTTSIGFALGPRINAIGRLADSNTALDLLLETNETRAKFIAQQLDQANKKRQKDQEVATQEAIAMVEELYPNMEDTKIIVIGSPNWHPGLIGLVAGKIAESFNRPALVCHIKDDGYAKGSCRSVRTFNILEALKSEKAWSLFKKRADGSTVCGGHAFAAGFELKSDNLRAMSDALNEYAKDSENITDEKIIDIDALLAFDDINENTYREISMLAPFGSMNPTPIFYSKRLKVVNNETSGAGKHLKLRLGNDKSTNWLICNAWRRGHESDKYPVNSYVDVAYTISMDEWMGRKGITLVAEDIKLSDSQ